MRFHLGRGVLQTVPRPHQSQREERYLRFRCERKQDGPFQVDHVRVFERHTRAHFAGRFGADHRLETAGSDRLAGRLLVAAQGEVRGWQGAILEQVDLQGAG